MHNQHLKCIAHCYVQFFIAHNKGGAHVDLHVTSKAGCLKSDKACMNTYSVIVCATPYINHLYIPIVFYFHFLLLMLYSVSAQ